MSADISSCRQSCSKDASKKFSNENNTDTSKSNKSSDISTCDKICGFCRAFFFPCMPLQDISEENDNGSADKPENFSQRQKIVPDSKSQKFREELLNYERKKIQPDWFSRRLCCCFFPIFMILLVITTYVLYLSLNTMQSMANSPPEPVNPKSQMIYLKASYDWALVQRYYNVESLSDKFKMAWIFLGWFILLILLPGFVLYRSIRRLYGYNTVTSSSSSILSESDRDATERISPSTNNVNTNYMPGIDPEAHLPLTESLEQTEPLLGAPIRVTLTESIISPTGNNNNNVQQKTPGPSNPAPNCCIRCNDMSEENVCCAFLCGSVSCCFQTIFCCPAISLCPPSCCLRKRYSPINSDNAPPGNKLISRATCAWILSLLVFFYIFFWVFVDRVTKTVIMPMGNTNSIVYEVESKSKTQLDNKYKTFAIDLVAFGNLEQNLQDLPQLRTGVQGRSVQDVAIDYLNSDLAEMTKYSNFELESKLVFGSDKILQVQVSPKDSSEESPKASPKVSYNISCERLKSQSENGLIRNIIPGGMKCDLVPNSQSSSTASPKLVYVMYGGNGMDTSDVWIEMVGNIITRLKEKDTHSADSQVPFDRFTFYIMGLPGYDGAEEFDGSASGVWKRLEDAATDVLERGLKECNDTSCRVVLHGWSLGSAQAAVALGNVVEKVKTKVIGNGQPNLSPEQLAVHLGGLQYLSRVIIETPFTSLGDVINFFVNKPVDGLAILIQPWSITESFYYLQTKEKLVQGISGMKILQEKFGGILNNLPRFTVIVRDDDVTCPPDMGEEVARAAEKELAKNSQLPKQDVLCRMQGFHEDFIWGDADHHCNRYRLSADLKFERPTQQKISFHDLIMTDK